MYLKKKNVFQENWLIFFEYFFKITKILEKLYKRGKENYGKFIETVF